MTSYEFSFIFTKSKVEFFTTFLVKSKSFLMKNTYLESPCSQTFRYTVKASRIYLFIFKTSFVDTLGHDQLWEAFDF